MKHKQVGLEKAQVVRCNYFSVNFQAEGTGCFEL